MATSRTTFISLLLSSLFASSSLAAISDSKCKIGSTVTSGNVNCLGGEIFLKGTFIEVGIHSVGSYGTAGTAPAGFVSSGRQLGFIADYDKNGFYSTTPGYAGDYFVPGAPVEGWILQWTNAKGRVRNKMMEGLMENFGMTPTTFQITSTDQIQSALWVGTVGPIEVTKVIQFKNSEVFFSTTVTIKNVGASTIADLYYMRTVDPDQEQPYYGNYNTRNYVQFQPYAADGSDCCLGRNYVSQTNPNTALVVAVGKNNYNFFCGLGTINSNARVSHWGFYENNPVLAYADASGDRQWTSYGGNDMQPTSAYSSRMYRADEAIHLVFKYPALAPGETVQLSYAYVLRPSDLFDAMAGLSAVTIIQPTSDISGSSARIAVAIQNLTVTSVTFFVYGVKSGVSSTATFYQVGAISGPSSSYAVTFDSTLFNEGDIQIQVAVVAAEGNFAAYKASRISNLGVVMLYTISDNSGTYPFSNAKPTTLNMTTQDPSLGLPDSISFYRESFANGQVMSLLIGTVTKAPWSVQVSCTDLVIGSTISVKASVSSYSERYYLTSTVFNGIVTFVNTKPSDLTLSLASAKLNENTANGLVVGVFSTSDVDLSQSHTYSLLDSAGGKFSIVGSALTVATPIDYETTQSLTILVRTNDGQSLDCCMDKSFTIDIADLNEPPTSMSPLSITTPENVAVGTVLATFSTVDQDIGQSFRYALNVPSTTTLLSSSGSLSVSGTIDYETTPSFSLLVRTSDNGSPNMFLDSIVTVTVTNLNEAPTSLLISCSPCIIPENAEKGTLVGTLSTLDPDSGDAFTYVSTATAPGSEYFAVSSSGAVTVQNTLSYQATGGSVSFTAKTQDSGGLSYTQSFVIVIQAVSSAPTTASVTCYADENLRVGDIVSSSTVTPAFCQIPASTNNNARLDYVVVSDQGIEQNYLGAFTVQSCSGVMIVNRTLDYETHNFYNLTIQVTSAGGVSYSHVVIYLVNVNEAPVLSSATFSVAENSNVGVVVASSLAANTYDQDELFPISASAFCCAKVYSISAGNADGFFAIVSSTGAISVAKTGLNYEAKNVYYLTLTVRDAGGLTSSAVFTIDISDVNEAPLLPSSSGTYTNVNENSPHGIRTGAGIVATDVDIGQSLTLSISGGNTADAFNLTSVYNSDTGVTSYFFTVHGSLDFESLSVYYLVVTATDNGVPPLSASVTYTVRVNDINEAPTLPSTQSFSIDENSARYTLVGTTLKSVYVDVDAGSTATFSITSYGSDAGKNFNIDATTGQLFFDNTLLSFEKTLLFTYVIRVTDNGGLFASSTVSIYVIDLPEAPVYGSFIMGYVTENVLGQYVRANGQEVEYVATDDDGDHLNFTVTSVNGVKSVSATNRFQVMPVSVTSTNLYTSASFDYESLKDYSVELQVTDRVFNVTKLLSVTVIDANDAPTVSAKQNCYVAENALSSTSICNIVGEDEDVPSTSWSTLTYSLVNPVSGLGISTAANTGTLYLTSDNSRSPGTVISSILVRVTDGGGLTAVQNITLTITAVNFPPACPTSPFSFSVAENTASSTTIATLTGTNSATSITDSSPTGVTLSCSISSGNSDGKFTMGSGCILKTSSSLLDYEIRSSYSLTIAVIEDTPNPLSTTCAVAVDVTDVNEPTTLNDQTFFADENILTGRLTSSSDPVDPVVVIDQDPADQHGLFSLVCISCGTDPISINQTTGVLSLKSGKSLNYEVLSLYQYQINWNSRGVTKQATLTLNINNLPEAPVATSTSITIAENTVGAIGFVSAIDPDFAGSISFTTGAICQDSCGLKYTVTGTTSGSFSVDVNTGAISLSSVSVDFEDADTHVLNILVKDSSGLSSTCDITITVTDVGDCAVTTISTLSGDPITSGSTSGGSQVFINGRNFGPTKHRMTVSAIDPTSVTASASLQSSSSTSVSTYVFPMACQIYRTSLYDNTLINCTLPPGIGKKLGVVVTISAKYGSSTKSCVTSFSSSYLSYGAPTLTEIVGGQLMPTSGGSSVILKGTNFGAKGATYNIVSATQASAYFSASVSCSVTTAHTQMTCTSASGIGSVVTWTAKVGGQTSAILSGMSSFAPPSITSVSSSLLDTAGGETFDVSGSNYGSLIANVMVTYGPTLGTEYTASCILGSSHYSLQCTSAPGIGKALKFIVTVGDQSNSVFTSTASYQKPVITSVAGSGVSSSSTAGGDIFFLSGAQFGPTTESSSTLVVTYGKTGTQFLGVDCKVVTAHTKVQCLTSPGTGINHQFLISIGGQTSVILPTNASYGPPTIASFTGDGASNALTSGYQTVYVSGTNFGAAMNTIDGVFYSEFNGTVFEATDNCTMYEPHRLLQCKTLPGAGKRLNWNVVVDGQLSASPTTSYSPPTITALLGPRVTNASVAGGDVMTISGQNFGPPNAYQLYQRDFLESVTYGASGSEYNAVGCVVVSNSMLTCNTVPGVGSSLYWVVTVAGQTSGLSTMTMSYAAPLISSITPNVASTDGTTKITLSGSNFAVETLPKLYFGGKRISGFFEAEDQIQFFVPVASSVVSSSYPIHIDVGGQKSNTVSFQYALPHIDTLNSIDSGNNTLTLSIIGSSFSLSPIISILPVDSDVPISPFCSKKLHTEIVCKISIRAGNVTVQTGVASSNTVFFQFGEPVLISSSLSSGSALTTGYTTQNRAQLYIIGQNFGASLAESIVSIVNTNDGMTGTCTIIAYTYVSKEDHFDEWNKVAAQVKGLTYNTDVDFQYLTCNLPPGQGKLNSLKIIKGSAYSLGCGCEVCTISTCFSYLAPVVSSVSPAIGSTGGSYTVALRGSNFGQIRTVSIGGVQWPVDTSQSNDTYIAVVAPPGEGVGKKVVVQVGNQNTSASSLEYFAYAAPVVNSFLSTIAVGTNGTTTPITVPGNNFGVKGPIVYLNDKVTLISFTHTTLTFNIPPGQGKGFQLSVNVSGQMGYSPDTFAYSPPHVTSATPLNCATNGGRETGVVMTLIGSNFGFQHLGWQLTVGDYTVSSADIISYSENEVKFYPPAGQGENLQVKFLVGDQSYTGGPFYFSYDPPQILSLVTPIDKNTAGGYTVSFQGLSFGTSGLEIKLYDPLYSDSTSAGVDMFGSSYSPMATQSSRMPPTTCTVTQQTHSLASCKVPPGVGNHLVFSFTVNGQSTNANFSYSPPVIEYFHSSNGGDASGGESLKIYGRNFGAFRTPLNISLGDTLCENSVWLADDPVYNYEPYLKCTTPATRVGVLNVSVSVAYQESPPNGRYTVECKSGAFGGLNEYCTSCGDPTITGLLCEYDNMYMPIAAEGWYMSLLSTPNNDCPTATQSRPACPAVLPCLPSKSCLGNNTCSKGYIDDRCATCDEGYYRISGRCEVCPNNPWLIFLVLFLCVSTSGYTAYKLAQKNVNLGILSIGIDYFQVLAVFGSADVSWPSSLINLYNSLSVFNFNVDILAPDCWAQASLPFKTKWIGITISPIIVLLLIALFYLGYTIYMKIWKPQLQTHNEMLYKCFALYLMAFYYGYLMLSNNTLAIFNCQPTDPSDGHTYMAEVGANGGICYEPGSTQQELEPWAIIAFVVYTVGFPTYVAFILYTSSDKCVYVQVMKAAGMSEGTEFEKQTLTRFKLQYNRLFYQFKPEFFYWVFCILVRKFCLSVSAVIFRENVVFLLALYMLILFVSYTAQVTYQPYMSTSEYETVAEKYADLISMYTRDTTSRSTRGTKMNINRLGNGMPIFKLEAPKIEFFNNYNTVESTLLFSAIFVSISAIMFESQELDGSQRDALAYVVILVVSLSLLYFFWVLLTELWVAFYPTVPLFCIKPKKVVEAIDTDIEFADVSYERQNPINDGTDRQMEMVRLQTQLETAEAMISQMQSEIGSLKKQRKTDHMVSTVAPVSAPKKGKKKTMSPMDGGLDGIYLSVEMT